MKTPRDPLADIRPLQDSGLMRRGEMAFADWVKAGMITLPPPAAVVEDQGFTLRNYGTKWRFARLGEQDR